MAPKWSTCEMDQSSAYDRRLPVRFLDGSLTIAKLDFFRPTHLYHHDTLVSPTHVDPHLYWFHMSLTEWYSGAFHPCVDPSFHVFHISSNSTIYWCLQPVVTHETKYNIYTSHQDILLKLCRIWHRWPTTPFLHTLHVCTQTTSIPSWWRGMYINWWHTPRLA